MSDPALGSSDHWLSAIGYWLFEGASATEPARISDVPNLGPGEH